MCYRDGVWEREDGGEVPVREGTIAELIVPQKTVHDKAFLAAMLKEDALRVLDQGEELFAYVMVKDISQLNQDMAKHLIRPNRASDLVALEFLDNWSGGQLCLVPVTIGQSNPDLKQHPRDEKGGGLWMRVRGRDVMGLVTSQIKLPEGIEDRPVWSLNHAFTRLSEVFEPWRTSHTGNIYERFLYQERNEKLYPLELFRDRTLAKHEQSIALELWQTFMQRTAAKEKKP